ERGDKQQVAGCAGNLAVIVIYSDPNYAKSLATEALGIQRDLGDAAGIVTSLTQLGSAAVALGEYGVAEAAFRECLVVNSEVGDSQDRIWCLIGFAALASAAD